MSIGDADSVQLCVFLLQPAVHLVHLTSAISNQVCAFRRYTHMHKHAGCQLD